MKHTIIYILAAIAFYSCTETIDLDLDQTPTHYVIDGLITNEQTKQYVKITESTGFYNADSVATVSGAEVLVTDDAGQEYIFEENLERPGYYIAEFQGIPERTYNLNVTLQNGEVFTAIDKMSFLPTIVDSLVWDVDEDEQEDPEEPGLFYSLKIYGKEPQATKDFYLFKFYRNDSIQNFDSNTGIFFADDELIGEFIYGLEAPNYYRKDDVARFEMYRLSREAFLFYNDLNNILNGTGGMFGPSPTNPRTNIQNSNGLGIGLFQVSAVEKSEIIVGE